MSPEILTISGRYFNFETPLRSEFDINDIAHALSHICRFNGHSISHYSVAQHSVLCSYEVPEEYALDALLHDAAEAFVGDITRPLKEMLGATFYLAESKVQSAITAMFGARLAMPKCVKDADLVLLRTEERDVMPPHDPWPFPDHIQPLKKRIKPWSAKNAKTIFLKRFEELTK